MAFLVSPQLLVVLFPQLIDGGWVVITRVVRSTLPQKSDIFQALNLLVREAAGHPGKLVTILFPLPLDPGSELPALCDVVWGDISVSMNNFIVLQLVYHARP